MTQISCDGSCLGNPGPGGWAAVIAPDGGRFSREGRAQILSGGDPDTTNNRMELTAVIRALEAVSPDSRAVVLCDSQYVVRGITDWIHNWKRRNWRTAGRRPVKNADLWKRLDTIRQRRPGVRFQWVRGHAGHPGNELAHETALREAMRRRRRGGTRSGDEGGPAHAGGSLFAASRPRG